MTRRSLAFVLGISIAATVHPVRAQPVIGPYVGLGGGYNALVDLHAHAGDPGLDQVRTNYRFGPGFVGAGSVGYGLGNGLRLEVEGAFDYNNVINRVHTPVAESTTGNQGTYGVLANAFYDVDLTKVGLGVTAFQPYVGVGAGVLWTHFSPLTSVGDDSVFRLGGTGQNFAYQAVVGLGFPIKAVPGLKFLVDYRFIGIDVRSGAVGNSFSPAGAAHGTVRLSPAFLDQVAFSLAYAFDHPAPAGPPPAMAVPAAAAPEAARTYLVFFDWDSSALTARARQIVAEAAGNAAHVAATRIEVGGYADTSHALPGVRGHDYNLALSRRRATVVQAELVRDGVPAGSIETHAFGDSNLLVRTGPDVREPQNRRVEIILKS